MEGNDDRLILDAAVDDGLEWAHTSSERNVSLSLFADSSITAMLSLLKMLNWRPPHEEDAGVSDECCKEVQDTDEETVAASRTISGFDTDSDEYEYGPPFVDPMMIHSYTTADPPACTTDPHSYGETGTYSDAAPCLYRTDSYFVLGF